MLNPRFRAHTAGQARPENVVVQGCVRVTVLEDRLFRVEHAPDGVFTDEATQAVWFRDLPPVPFEVSTDARGRLVVTTARAALAVGAETTVTVDGAEHPLGETRGNLGGTYRTLDRCDGDLCLPDEFNDVPAHRVDLGRGVVSRTGVAVLDDSASLLLAEDGMPAPRAHAERDLYIFAYGHDYRAAVRALFRVTGPAPVLPRFALGNWWSRYHAYTDREYLHLMDDFIARRVPFTVATVDMDWHWSTTLDERKGVTRQGLDGEEWGTASGWTGYSWNTDLFPDHAAFLRGLHARGLRVTLNLHPALGIRWFEDRYPEMARATGVDPASKRPVRFDMTDPAFVNAYFDVLHRPMEAEGVDFWWVDWQQGTGSRVPGLDPLWLLNHFHTLDHAGGEAPLVLSRYAGVGSHRCPVGFSGDTWVTWETLRYLPYFTATASNAGYTWWSHDIGGHMNGVKDDELFVRFLQFGVFSPINRLHSTDNPFFTKEAWAYPNGAGLIAEEFLRLRHRLIPYLYSASVATHREGTALVEPLYYAWPEEENAYRYRNEYLFGGQLLVVPVTEHSPSDGLTPVRAWLPEGRWTDIFTGDEYRGGGERTLVRSLDFIPVLLREGGFLAEDARDVTNDPSRPDRLLVTAADGEGTWTLFEDPDGREATVFRSEEADSLRRVSVTSSAPERLITLRFANVPSGRAEVTADGAPCPFDWDDNRRLTVTWTVRPHVRYQVTVRPEGLAGKRDEALRREITRLQMENNAKRALRGELAAPGAAARLREDARFPEPVRLRLIEVLEAWEEENG